MQLPPPSAFDDDIRRQWQRLLSTVTLTLLAVAFAAVLGRHWIDDDGLRRSLLSLHRGAGLAVLAVTLLRPLSGFWRQPPMALGPALLRTARATLHGLFYGLLLVTPLLGWAESSARSQITLFMGAIPLPALVGHNGAFATRLHGLHAALAMVTLVLVALRATLGGRQSLTLGSAWRQLRPLLIRTR